MWQTHNQKLYYLKVSSRPPPCSSRTATLCSTPSLFAWTRYQSYIFRVGGTGWSWRERRWCRCEFPALSHEWGGPQWRPPSLAWPSIRGLWWGNWSISKEEEVSDIFVAPRDREALTNWGWTEQTTRTWRPSSWQARFCSWPHRRLLERNRAIQNIVTLPLEEGLENNLRWKVLPTFRLSRKYLQVRQN